MDLTQTLMLGELSLDGSLHPVRGALPMVISASEQGIVDIILPEGNAEEVACIQGLRVYPASSLRAGGESPEGARIHPRAAAAAVQ